MNFQFCLNKLENSKEFKSFINKNPEAYMCSGFFVVDVSDGRDNQSHIDFFLPSKKKVFSFKLNSNKIEKVPMDFVLDKIPEPISKDVDFNLDEIEKIVLAGMEKNRVKSKLQKIMISLQKFKGKDILVCTIFLSMLGLLKVHIDLNKNKITIFEKKNLFDMFKKS